MPETGIPVAIDSRPINPRLHGKHVVKFERGYCFLEEPGKNISWIWPKHIERMNPLALVVDTGFWQYGKLNMKFDFPIDADRTEAGLRKMLSSEREAPELPARQRSFTVTLILVFILFVVLIGAVYLLLSR